MNNRIDTQSLSSALLGRVTRAEQGGQSSSQESVSGVSQSRLSLTESASRLQQAASAGNGEAVFDARRVAEIKDAIANGSYRVDPGVVADQLIHFDRSIDF